MSDEEIPDKLPARMLNEFVYCPRLCYLEWVQSQFCHSSDTLEGLEVHRRVDDGGISNRPDGVEAVRSLMLSSDSLGMISKMDMVEIEGKVAVPVDYKKGKIPDQGAWPQDKVQVCAQGLILRDNGYEVERGELYYSGSRSRVKVEITSELEEMTVKAVSECREMVSSGEIPPPLANSPKCMGCSLAGICLPDEVGMLSRRSPQPQEVRRLHPASSNSYPVYVFEQGSKLGKSGEEMVVWKGNSKLQSCRLVEMSSLSLFGRIQITDQMLKELCNRGIPICHLSRGGWFYGITHGMTHKNVELRMQQYATAMDEASSVRLARRMVEGKIRNARTLLRRNSVNPSANALKHLNMYANASIVQTALDTLRGVEGSAARIYFMHFPDMLKSFEEGFDFDGRNRRPPKDPVNSMLSYLYAMMVKDMTVTLLKVGFDPYLGVFHCPKYGRPALALDLIEEFRPLIADSAVLSLVNNGEVDSDSFVCRGNSVAMKDSTKKKVIRAYERRMDQSVQHPLFKYRVSYRRLFEIQARLLSRCLSGELEEYPPFMTR